MTPFERKLRGQLEALAAAGHSKASAAMEMGVAATTLRRWLALVDPERTIVWPPNGSGNAPGRRIRPAGKPLTEAERDLVNRLGELARAGCSKIEAADELGIHRATLDRWLAWMDPNRTLPWPRPGQTRGQRRHQQRIRLRVVAVGRRKR